MVTGSLITMNPAVVFLVFLPVAGQMVCFARPGCTAWTVGFSTRAQAVRETVGQSVFRSPVKPVQGKNIT